MSSFFVLNPSEAGRCEEQTSNIPCSNYGYAVYTLMDQKSPDFIIIREPLEETSCLPSRSKKSCANPFESSFQNNFLYEHIEACQSKIQNLIEAVAQSSKKIQKQTLKEKVLIPKGQQNYQLIQILDSHDCQIDHGQKKQFKMDLKYQKKLNEFLDYICQKFTPKVAGQLLTIANFIWNQYLKVIDQKLFQQELIKWAQNLAQNRYQDYSKFLEKTKQLLFQEDQSEAFPNFQETIKEFMKYYIVTVTLVIQQYFENPFFNDQKEFNSSLKRFSSEEDSYSQDQFSQLQEGLCGSKKFKFF